MTSVKKINKTVSRETVQTDIRYLCLLIRPSWKDEHISFKKLAGGLINDIYRCTVPSDPTEKDALIVRLYSSQNVSDVIDRNKEIFGMQVAQAAEVAEPLYLIFNNGLVYGYADGDLGYWGMLWDDQISRLYMKMLTSFHAVDILKLQLLNTKGEPAALPPKLHIFDNLRQAVKDIPDEYENFPDRKRRVERTFWSKRRLLEEINTLQEYFSKFNFKVVFAHNDAWVWNVIFNKESGKLSLIDFEFADFNYEASDLATLFHCFQLFEFYNQLMPPTMNTTQEELKLPRTAEHKRKLTKMYLEERCVRQGKSPTDFSKEEFEKFYNQTEMMTIFLFFYWMVFLMTQFDDPEVPWDCISFAEHLHKQYTTQRRDLYAFKPR